jgi:NADH-quinone oxidoreductase subunit M
VENIILNQLPFPVLSTLIFTPIVGALVLLCAQSKRTIRWISLFITLYVFTLSLPLFINFDKSTANMQFVEIHKWIPSLGIHYSVGVDGISILFILLTTILSVLSVAVSWTSIVIKVRDFHIALLMMEGAMIGVFSAMDFLLFYLFWEAMLIPMFLLIGVWGGPNRIYSAIKFFLYTLVGSVLMLVGMIVLYFEGGNTLDIRALSAIAYPINLQVILFLAFFAAFAVKVPMFPFHTWLPDAHTEAPTAGSVVLAGVLLKMGGYGFLRFSLPMFPDAMLIFKTPLLILSVIAITYGALLCLAQKDLKRLIAYSSVSHMGFVTIGIFALNAQGLEGGILQMINHGIITGALFLMIGIIYERTHSREISDYGGLAQAVPVYASLFIIFTLASIGLPGTNGFVGEFLIILGIFKAYKLFGILAATGIILGAVYMLWLYQKVFFEKFNPEYPKNALWDLNARELALLVPLIAIVFWIGIFPESLLSYLHPSVEHLLEQVKNAELQGDFFAELLKK